MHFHWIKHSVLVIRGGAPSAHLNYCRVVVQVIFISLHLVLSDLALSSTVYHSTLFDQIALQSERQSDGAREDGLKLLDTAVMKPWHFGVDVLDCKVASMFLKSQVKVCKLQAESLFRPLGQIRGPVVSLGSCCQAIEALGLITLHSHTAELRHL